MKRITHQYRDQPRKSHVYIPMDLLYEAEKWAVSIDDTCIEALQRKIHDQKKAHYLQHHHLA